MCLERKLTTFEKIKYNIFNVLPKPKVAKEDIVCYKFFSYNMGVVPVHSLDKWEPTNKIIHVYNSVFYPTIEGYTFIEGSENCTINAEKIGVCVVYNDLSQLLCIQGGYFHCFKDKIGDKTIFLGRHCIGEENVKQFKIIIPAGTKYYEGVTSCDGIPCYAAETLIIKEEV